jgi:transposase-like protein
MRHRTDDEKRLILAALQAGETVREICIRLKAAPQTVRKYRDAAGLPKQPHGVTSGPRVADSIAAMADAPVAAPAAREIRDASFWRARANEERTARTEAEHIAEALAGVRATPISIPEWVMTPGHPGKSVVCGLLSDIHMGEVIAPDEIDGINAFNVEIARQRLRRYFQAFVEVGKRWASDTECQGAYLALGGDLVSGDIHEELRITNDLTAHEQVAAVVEEVEAGVKLLLKAYGRVHIPAVPGNHGRTTPKPTAKLASRLSYDMLVAQWLADRFRGVAGVTWQFGAARDQTTPILGRPVFLNHGDAMGTKGGMGFAGPNLPIVRGGNKVALQQSSVGRRPYLILCGHYHTSSNPSGILANGSVPGYSEFGATLRASVEPPQQWLFLMHSKWGLRERASIQLEAPEAPVKPRVSIPAVMAAA